VIHSSRPNVLVVSRKNALQSAFESCIQDFDYNLEFADCEYQCSMLVEGFQPDFVIIDCSRGPVWSKEIAQHIHDDPRVPYVRIILVGDRKNIPAECDKMILAFIEEPFTVSKFTNLVDDLWEKDSRQALPGRAPTLPGN
jgi:DNA-binding NtrC family response regulator